MKSVASRADILKAIGITRWQRRGDFAPDDIAQIAATAEPVVADAPEVLADPEHIALPETETTAEVSAEALSGSGHWAVLRQQVSACKDCGLHERRTQAVLGSGDTAASWMLVGEAPGEEEDASGEAFVGKAGHLLDEMLLAVGLNRADVYIANTVKCRPPNDDDPTAEQVSACAQYLDRQIELLKPDFILALGKTAAMRLAGLKPSASLTSVRGKVLHYGDAGIPVVVTYHPAYYLRSPREKRKGWDDLVFARNVVSGNQS